MSLADFLVARISEEEGWAHGADRLDSERPIDRLTGAEIFKARGLMFPVARVLADCDAKRRIVEEHGEGRPWSPAQNPGRCRVCTAISNDGGAARFRAPCPTLRFLALPYANHPDYRDEWRP